MFKQIFLFELKYRIKRPGTWAYFGLLFLFGLVTSIYGNTPSSEKVFANAPAAITQMLTLISLFGMLIASAVMGVPLYRDIEHKVKDYFFSYPVTEKGYFLGRYFGSLLFLLLITFGFQLGMMIGFSLGPFAGLEEADRFAPLNLWHFLQPTFIYYWPNLIFTGTIFFCLVAFTKKVNATYVGSVLFFIGYLLANALIQDLDKQNLVDILDPFAFNTLNNITRYWTPVEQNTMLTSLSGNLLWNRILWIGVSLVIFFVSLFRFDFIRFLDMRVGKKLKASSETVAKKVRNISLIPKGIKSFSNQIYLRHMFNMSKLETGNILRDVYFLAMIVGGLLFLFLDGWFGFTRYSTPDLPTTFSMLQVKDFTYIIFVYIILIFYAGEVVHRDKSVKYAGISDALPVPNWVMYGSKFLALVLVCFLLVNMVMVCGLANQILRGYFRFEFAQYFTDLYLIELPEYLQLTMLAFFVHILVNKKFLGHVLSISIWLIMFGLRDLAEIDYNLFFYSYTPNYLVSDMNGFGHLLKGVSWFNFYWLALGVALMILGNLLWNRGPESGFKTRMKVMRQRMNTISVGALAAALICWVGAGAFIYYNVSVLNEYKTGDESTKESADYEKTLSKYANILQPKVVDLKLYADIFPKTRSAKAKAVTKIVNKWDVRIDSLHLLQGGQVDHNDLTLFTIDGKEPTRGYHNETFDYSIYAIEGGMAPGDTMEMIMEVDLAYKGFPNSGFGQAIVENGTFFNLSVFPSFGYNPQGELSSEKDRKKYELPEKDYGLPERDDSHGLSNFLFGDDADFNTFEAVLSTDPDQIAISPGYLVKEWEENGRKYYHYKMDEVMQMFFNVSSARYAVIEDTWKNPDGSKGNIQVFHHPDHTVNIDRMVRGIQHSMAYFTENFSPYQFNQMRILEFPRYATFAQSFPNTVPYAESFGWQADFSDPNDTDYFYYVTSHEVAHQWWGHQLVPSATRGANQLSESMAEYSALMVMKQEYEEEVMQKFLRYSLDSYLRGRSGESKFEKTLIENDNQAYVWYRKGSLILYALQDYIGEDSLNRAFSAFMDEFRLRDTPPFVTTDDWYGYLDAATPDSLKYFIEDSFQKIVLYENKMNKATWTQNADNSYTVKLDVSSKKTQYDGLGEILDEPTSQNFIEIGIFAEDTVNDRGMDKKVPLYLKKHWLKPGDHSLEITVSKKPEKAGIDPYTKLIDRIPNDNMKDVEGE